MNRREAVQYISILLGGTLIGADSFLSGCNTKTGSTTEFTPENIAYLDEIADTILPTTSTPGAKAAKVGQFMTVMVNDCYEAGDQQAFHEGLNKLNEASKKKYDKTFMDLAPDQRTALLIEIDKEAKEYQKKVSDFNNKEGEKEKAEIAKGNKNYKRQSMAPHYFTMMKQLTLLGYFTSEIGTTQARRYKAVPGSYQGCIPYKKGDKAWA
ncbi:MAG TPA: gluconate 2-dehydrogenase subunit 3 family protein [Flavisolibacter sp.]|jgi:hypothetical protein|nr:gluconate 2-dehydrogenase subunit 3 family protein [Flavisolibacter sp.]